MLRLYGESVCRVVAELGRVDLRDYLAPPTRKAHLRRQPHNWYSGLGRLEQQMRSSQPRYAHNLALSAHVSGTDCHERISWMPQGHVRIAG